MVVVVINGARGLEYLHEHSNPPVVHRDIKSSNILLDSNYNAKVRSIGCLFETGIHDILAVCDIQ